MKGGEKSPSAICNIIPRLADTLFPEKMAPRKLPGDVCNNLRAFLLPVSMTTTWHAWRLRNREGRQTLPFSLRQNAFSPIHSNSLTGKHNRAKDQPQQNTDIYPPPPPLLAVFSLQTPEQTLSFMKNMRYRTNLICVGRHMPHTHGGWFRRLFRSVLIFHPWRVGGVRVAVVSPSQWQRLPLQRGRRWTGGKSCPAAAQTNHSTYYTSLLENALRNIQLIFSKIQRECEQFHQ